MLVGKLGRRAKLIYPNKAESVYESIYRDVVVYIHELAYICHLDSLKCLSILLCFTRYYKTDQ
jgi:hypothetical protein